MKAKNYQSLLLKIALIVISYVVVFFLIKSGVLNRQYRALIVPIGVNVILAVSLNLITGFLGELTLGHAGFMSIGAYAGALFSLNVDLPRLPSILLSMLIGGVVAGIFGFLIGVPVLRLRGDYLAIVTLAFGEIIKSVLISMKVTKGAKGLSGIPIYSSYKNFTIVFVAMVLCIVFISNLVKSRQGRAVCAIRDNDIAAESIGIPVSKFKVMAFVISAFFAGIAGVLYAHNVGILKPTTFDYNKSIEILVFVVLGGMGSIKGSIIAAIILTALPEMLRGAENYRMLLYAIALIVLMLFNGSGIKEKLFPKKSHHKLQKAGE
ncbi:MAG TPA: branched-chain amino acid ABC transporter permease [Candidatus Merdenecus merdavium]|nr:branched-chain amino acid ABC transporter permease [Candidatus Merdenecus merdavium]